MRYSLRTLLVLLALGPPLLAWGWRVGESAVAEYRARQQAEEWTEVGGPGIVAEFPTSCFEAEADPVATQ